MKKRLFTQSKNSAGIPRKKILYVAGVLLLVAAVAGVTTKAIMYMNEPAVGIVRTASLETFDIAEPAEEVVFNGKNFSFMHPAYYKQTPQNRSETGSLERHIFQTTIQSSKVIAITITLLPSGTLETDPSYTMRKLKPEIYMVKQEKIKGDTVATAKDIKTGQKSAFWVHGTKLLTITITGSAPDSVADEAEFRRILDTVVWK